MPDVSLTLHAEVRMRQRGFRMPDIDLIRNVATQIADDAYFLTDQDTAREISRRKREIQQLERLRGSKIIMDGGAIITLYHVHTVKRRSSNKRIEVNHE